ncbi:flagellar FlbD family protein [Thermotoga sp. 38H-to]|uniref:flagellar FlbD family protein n=1 Tax=Thermotoga sp. 38H-to TaxID=1755812 RepID=UPI0013E9DAEA|nr:flagellar FlbD family protein [Thermotoga sp. 38H-to]KAF2959845.1 flagellar protein [Thermotoga sp. 38H-to]
MIRLTKIDGRWFFLNADLIEAVEALPDTTITLINGKKYIVKESAEEVVQRVIEYKRKIFNWWKEQGR